MPSNPLPAVGAPLTEREREIVWFVAQGGTNAQVGERLGLSELTVKSHLVRIRTKLDARDRAHMVLQAVRSGDLEPSPLPSPRPASA